MDIMCVLYPQYIYSVDPAASHKTKQKTLMSKHTYSDRMFILLLVCCA